MKHGLFRIITIALMTAAAAANARTIRAEIDSVRIRPDGKGGWQLIYNDCASCPLVHLKLVDDTQIVLDGEPVNIERARIYASNGVYLVAQSGTARRVEFKRN